MVAVQGGPQAAANTVCHPPSQGQLAGRCRTSCRAEVEMRAGTWMSLLRMVPLRAMPRSVPASVPMAQDRLNAILANTRQAAFAV